MFFHSLTECSERVQRRRCIVCSYFMIFQQIILIILQLDFESDEERKFDFSELYGTPRYMAPECLRKWSTAPSVDIWSFGCLFLRMITGAEPWEKCESKFNVFFALGSAEELQPYNLDEIDCSKEGTAILKSIFTRNQAERPSAVELLSDPYFSDLPENIL